MKPEVMVTTIVPNDGGGVELLARAPTKIIAPPTTNAIAVS